MSIGEQIKHLKELSDAAKVNVHSFEELRRSLKEAADTIESLSAKLVAENMKRPDRYYSDGWIACEDRLPEKIGGYYIVSVKSEVSGLEYTRPSLYDKDGFATRIDEKPVAWQPLPEPYCP